MAAEQTALTIILTCDESERRWRSFMTAFPPHLDKLLDAVRVQVVPDNIGPIPVPGDPKYVGLPGFVKDRIRAEVLAAVARLSALVLSLIEMWRYLASLVGSPTQLRATAQSIVSSLVPKAREFDSTLRGEPLDAANERDAWDSPAADSYGRAFRKFSGQTGSIPIVAAALAEGLEDAADAIDAYYAALKKALFYAVFSFAGFALALLTFETGVGAIVGLVIGFIGIIGTFDSMNDMEEATQETQGEIVDSILATPNLKWKTASFAS